MSILISWRAEKDARLTDHHPHDFLNTRATGQDIAGKFSPAENHNPIHGGHNLLRIVADKDG